MDKKEIKHITGRHYQKLTQYIKGIIPGLDPEMIHQFRVEYKKLRAFLRMISGDLDLKISRKLKKGYNILGSIRDLQLQRQRILEASKQTIKKPQAYLNLLQKEIAQLEPELLNIFSEDPMEECKKKTNASVPDEYSINRFRNYINQKWMTIHAIILSGHFSDDHVHLIRKHLKDLSYNLKAFEITEPDILSQSVWRGKEAFYFDRLPDELGNFQDKCMALALLKPYWLLALNKYNRDHLQRIRNTWIKDKVDIKKMLVKKLRMGMVSGMTGAPIAEVPARL